MHPRSVPLRVYRYAVATGDAPLAALLALRLFRGLPLTTAPPTEAASRAVETLARHLGLRLPEA